ncbi:TPA: MerR family transcriptional regulator [Legionella pneumophila]|uniref:MerR family transcriptional regulator n=2 Tax=Legionella TaxID=445 RepID=A0A9X2D1M8_9GAMM|nr:MULTISPECIES: MerR family transcriptional regulator [Legionella]MCA0402511.1 MerR family transcriptional regulator [Pseudomonadota bacterium]MCL9684132.1 MerR family transcriptional regulator [Legionella maioricensis]MCL9686961.1 MerR family transcriptional regulator [Legionella maioricensis]RYV83389.1 MerR family transcriptional regulator [Legionella pneumophila]RYW49944.1 MerR family transcriptional regulator [Legionella pneumophila]
MMTKWHIKEISELTQTSVRMLRHYDKIGLLQPSYLEPNGYRCYTEPDLAKLQQIIALKYFGFSLSKIKDILQKHSNVYAHLQAQHQVIRKQSEDLLKVNQVLEEILKSRSASMFPNWQDLLLLIEGYKMTENLRDKLKKTWAGKQLTVSQFEDYLFLYEQFPEEFALRDSIIEEMNQQKVGDPEGPDGERIAAVMEDLSKKMKKFFTEQVKLGASLLESIQSGRLTQLEITPEGAYWLSRAMMAYSLKRWNNLYNQIIDNMNSPPEGEHGKRLAQEWKDLIDNYLAAGNRDYLIGILLWQEISRQEHEVKALKTMPPPQEMIKPWHIKLLFNAEASAWISKALETHQ